MLLQSLADSIVPSSIYVDDVVSDNFEVKCLKNCMFSSFIFNLKLLAGQAELSVVQVHFRRELRSNGDVAFVNF